MFAARFDMDDRLNLWLGMGRRNRDTTGPITRTVADAARVLEAMVGYDPGDNLTTLFLQVCLSQLWPVSLLWSMPHGITEGSSEFESCPSIDQLLSMLAYTWHVLPWNMHLPALTSRLLSRL